MLKLPTVLPSMTHSCHQLQHNSLFQPLRPEMHVLHLRRTAQKLLRYPNFAENALICQSIALKLPAEHGPFDHFSNGMSQGCGMFKQ